jgi:hypothetical protein
MKEFRFSKGKGRTKIELLAYHLGDDLIVCLYNKNAHLGAVAIGEYDHKEERASSSVITRLGHRDDEIAKREAHFIAKHTQKPVCVITGIHLDNITKEEISQFLTQADGLITELVNELEKSGEPD